MKVLGKTVSAAQALNLTSIATAMLSDKYGAKRVTVNLSQLGIVIKVDNSIALTTVQNLNGSGSWTVNYDSRYVNFDGTADVLTGPGGSLPTHDRKPTMFPDGSTEPRGWWSYLGVDWAKILAV